MVFVTAVSQGQVHGHQPGGGNIDVRLSKIMHMHYRMSLLATPDLKVRRRHLNVHASIGKDTEDVNQKASSTLSAEVRDEVPPTQSPFVGAKISSRIPSKTGEAGKSKSAMTPEATPSTTGASLEVRSPFSTASVPMPASSPPTNQRSSSGKASLQNLTTAKPSVFLNSSTSIRSGSRRLLDALKEAEDNGNFGKGFVPKELFDEPKMVPDRERKFQFSMRADQLALTFSFLTIVSVMFGTAFLVWKVGGIHYNEY